MATEKKLPLHECFYTWQGEGSHLGRSAFFIRLFGCPVHCPWCDSAGTWHPDYIPKEIKKYTAAELTKMAQETNCEFVVITGGEPAIHDLTALTTALSAANIKVHLETSGAFELKGKFDWITVSPKWWKLPLPENISKADELKLIVEDETSIEKWMAEIGAAILPKNEAPKNAFSVWLHPEWSKRNDATVLKSISEKVKASGTPFRAGLQAHKYYAVDALDARSAKPAPLGGDKSLGY